jgi:ADP-dependent NAD(P)H-hydrate dehydratase / NAD(P)H-hydrate epimerase
METLVSTQTMENIDSKAQSDYAMPGLILMEQAGVKGWHAFLEFFGKKEWKDLVFLFLAGGGNNGGDALVMAREAFFSGLERYSILLGGSHISTACATQRSVCRSMGMHMHESETPGGLLLEESVKAISEADVIIDGLAGTGLRGTLTGNAAELVKLVNARKTQGAMVCSVDIPSGCSDAVSAAGNRIHADVTITMGLQKAACYHPPCRPSWGRVIRINPSFPPALLRKAPAVALLVGDSDLQLPPIDAQSYKNRRGHLALFAGSQRYSGASRLAARAAFHARAGLVTLFCDEDIAHAAGADSPSVIVKGIPVSTIIESTAIIKNCQAVAAGPGWGEDRDEQLLEILRSGLPTVVDADGIDCFARLISDHRLQIHAHGPLVLTPHPGELHRMLETLHMPLLAQETGATSSPESFIDSLRRVAVALGVVLVYKSHVVWIVDGRSTGNLPLVVDGMNSALGVAGSGDVLTGIIGAFLAQGMDVLDAAKAGVAVHQKAGILAKDDLGWFDSLELIGKVGKACREFERCSV